MAGDARRTHSFYCGVKLRISARTSDEQGSGAATLTELIRRPRAKLAAVARLDVGENEGVLAPPG